MALYRYTDTDERTLREAYPSEALNFNGVFFEDEIKGYRTLNVSGREAMESEISSIGTNARHGERFRGRRYLPRVITVRYRIVAQDAMDLIEKFNRLNHLLDAEEATLIFNDEPDKYFTGTCRNLLPPSEGELVASGSFELYCADPFKYSVEQYEVRAVDGAITTHYRGTVPNPPVFQIRAKADTALVELLKDVARVKVGLDINILHEAAARSKKIVSNYTDMNIITIENAILPPCIPESATIFYKEGELVLPEGEEAFVFENRIEYQTESIEGEEWLVPMTEGFDASVTITQGRNKEYNTYGDNAEELVGPQIGPGRWASIEELDSYYLQTAEDPDEDLRGTGLACSLDGAESTNFTLSFEARIYAENTLEGGAQCYTIHTEGTHYVPDENDGWTEEACQVPLFGLGIQKVTIGTNRLEMKVYVNNSEVGTIIMSSLASNEVFGKKSLPCSMSRFGSEYKLKIGNETYCYTGPSGNIPTYMSVYVCNIAGMRGMTCNAVRYVKYESEYTKTARGKTNIIREGDEVVIDCASADIRVNGISEPGLGDIANQWDAMDLEPGDNNIAVITVADDIPEVVMEYREAYI